MQIVKTPDSLIITDTPGCLWLVGLFFAIIGGIFVYGSLGGLTDYGTHPLWMLLVSFVMGAIAVGSGIWIIFKAPITKVVINRLNQNVIMSRWDIFGRRNVVYDFDDIQQFCLIEGQDDEGDQIWNFGMELINGEMIKITSISSHAENYERNYVFQTNEFMGKQLSPSQLIFELEDETNDEMS